MVRVVIFTEGQSEMIFIRRYLLLTIDNSKLSFNCFKLYSHKLAQVQFYSTFKSLDPKIYFLIIDVTGDGSVISAIRERGNNYLESGYDFVIGIRDLYCEEYEKRSPGRIDGELSKKFIENSIMVLQEKLNLDKVIVIYSIMELEAWFLGMYNLYFKINRELTVENILGKLNLDLRNVDPQKEFYKPTYEIDKIFNLIGMKYEKSVSFLEMITSHMETTDFREAIENGRCENFRILQDKLNDLI
jgi:hypothetical protein